MLKKIVNFGKNENFFSQSTYYGEQFKNLKKNDFFILVNWWGWIVRVKHVELFIEEKAHHSSYLISQSKMFISQWTDMSISSRFFLDKADVGMDECACAPEPFELFTFIFKL